MKGPLEKEIQAAVERYLDLRGLYFIRIPDALYRWVFGAGASIPVWVRGLISSYMKGQPDLIILKPMGNGRGCFALPLELKSESGEMSDEQLRIQAEIGTFIAHSEEEAIKIIDEFILLRAT